MTITKAAKEYAVPRLEGAVEYATPKVGAAVDYAAPRLEAAREVAVAKAAEAMERLTPHAEALRDRLVERASSTAAEASRRGQEAAEALAGRQPRKRRTAVWTLLGLLAGVGAGLLASRSRRGATPTPAWTNYGVEPEASNLHPASAVASPSEAVQAG